MRLMLEPASICLEPRGRQTDYWGLHFYFFQSARA